MNRELECLIFLSEFLEGYKIEDLHVTASLTLSMVFLTANADRRAVSFTLAE